jgi:hypothetical protein
MRLDGQMSITIIQILRAMVFEDAYIAVLRGPTHDYGEHISLRRADGRAATSALGFSRAMLNDLVEANFVKREGPEDDQQTTAFKLTVHGRRAVDLSLIRPDSKLKAFLKAKLLGLGYPWPDHLEGKNIAWLKTEIEAINPVDDARCQAPPTRRRR